MVVRAIRELRLRVRYCLRADRIGPDLIFTHWMLHFPGTFQGHIARKFAHFGSNVEIRPGAYAIACSKISLGENVVIRPGTMLFADPRSEGAGITIERNVLIGSSVHVYTVNHEYRNRAAPVIEQGHMPSRPVVLREGCWVGASAVILPGVVVGRNSVVGAGSVVTKSVEDGAVVAGNPARLILSPPVDMQ